MPAARETIMLGSRRFGDDALVSLAFQAVYHSGKVFFCSNLPSEFSIRNRANGSFRRTCRFDRESSRHRRVPLSTARADAPLIRVVPLLRTTRPRTPPRRPVHPMRTMPTCARNNSAIFQSAATITTLCLLATIDADLRCRSQQACPPFPLAPTTSIGHFRRVYGADGPMNKNDRHHVERK